MQEEDAQAALSTISFGALAKAQASLSRTSKAKLSSTVEDRGHSSIIAEYVKDETKRPSKDKADHLKASKKKTSKSAPTEMSSKRPVTRKREVVPVPSRNARDPRFDSAVGRVNEEQFSKNYAFLKDYQDSEISVLKEQIKKTKDERLREQLRAKLKPMESRKQTEESKRKAAELLREHKQKERELVKQGKKPYFLPRCMLLILQFHTQLILI